MANSAIPAHERAENTQFEITCPISKQLLVQALWHCRNRLTAEINVYLSSHCAPGPDGQPDRSTMEEWPRSQVDELDRDVGHIDFALARSHASCAQVSA